MQTPQIIYLIAQTVLFIIWAFMMFRMLWAISRRKKGLLEGGGLSDQMGAFMGFFRDRANRRFLLILAILSALLMAVNIAGAYLLVPT